MQASIDLSACARLIGELFKQRTQRAGAGDSLRERQSQRRPPFLQLEALGIDTNATPFAVGRAKQRGSIKPASVSMIGIHVCNRIRLRLDERPCIGNISQDVLRLEIDNAAKAGNQMHAGDLDPIEREVREVRELFGFRMTPQIRGAV